MSLRSDRVLAALFVAAGLLHLLPIWRVHYIPTVDGPSHLYNAVVLQQLGHGVTEFTRVFEADLRPHPNWLAHAILRASLAVVPPLVAEKILFSAIVLLFLSAVWMLAGLIDRANRVYALLAMPLTFHLLLQMGFYSYSLGVPLMLFAIVLWWRNRTVAVAVVLVLCYFAHAVPAAMGTLLVAAGSIISRPHRRDLFAVIAPGILFGWFFLQPLPGGHWSWKGAFLWKPLVQIPLLMAFDPRQLTFGTILGATFVVLIALTLVLKGNPERFVFLLMALIAVAVYLAAPVSLEEGLLLKARLLLFPYLLLLPWLTPRLARWPLAAVFAIAASANVFFIRDQWKRSDQDIARAIAPLASALPRHTLLPLIFDRTAPHATIPLLSHAIDYAAAERQLIDFSDYEAAVGYFPVRFRSEVRRPAISAIETAPGSMDLDRYSDAIDYVYTWKMPAGAAVEKALFARYVEVTREGDAVLYRRKAVSALPEARSSR